MSDSWEASDFCFFRGNHATFPYTFGFLLSRAIFKKFAEQGSDFLEQYEYFLKISGSYDCEEVVSKSLGEDITSKEFWADSIKTLEEPLGKLKEILAKRP